MKVLKVKKNKKTVVTEKIIHETDLGFLMTETIINGKHKGVTLSCKDKGLDPFVLDLPEDWAENYEDFYGLLGCYQIKPKTVDEVDEDKIYFVYSSGHMLFDKNRRIISVPYLFNYIGSLREKEPNDPIYAKLIKLLKKHPYFLSLEEEEIPYYNCSFSGQKGIAEAKVLLPQDKYEEIYEKYKDDEFWSCRLTDHLSMSLNCVGIYGDEVDALLKEYWRKKEDF